MLNHTKITVNELAEIIGTTERTIFSDLQSIRSQLPEGWDIISDQAGISLQNQQNLLTNDLWEIFSNNQSRRTAEKSAFYKKVAVPDFLADHGLSYAFSDMTKINQRLVKLRLADRLDNRCLYSWKRACDSHFYHQIADSFHS